jgi:hypothetical protein
MIHRVAVARHWQQLENLTSLVLDRTAGVLRVRDVLRCCHVPFKSQVNC